MKKLLIALAFIFSLSTAHAAQHDMIIDNQGFPSFRSDLNNGLMALATTSSGTSAPSTTFANQIWYDTTNDVIKFRNEANSAWIPLLTLDQAGNAVSGLTITGSFSAASYAPTSSSCPANGLNLVTTNTLGLCINSAQELQLTSTALSPFANDGSALGTTSLKWSDLFLASGAVINFNNGDVLLTHSSNTLAMTGGALTLDTPLAVTSGGTGKTTWTAPTTQVLTPGSGTYTKPAGVAYLKVTICAGGGGGGGSGTSSLGTGASGGNSAFGSLLFVSGGVGGTGNGTTGGSGGSYSISAPAVAIAGFTGATGEGAGTIDGNNYVQGGSGASGPLGGGGGGAGGTNPGGVGAAAECAGGGGAGNYGVAGSFAGSGGGYGGYAQAYVPSPASTYSYTVAAAGTGGAAGVSGRTGGNGGAGIIIVEEFYQ